MGGAVCGRCYGSKDWAFLEGPADGGGGTTGGRARCPRWAKKSLPTEPSPADFDASADLTKKPANW